MLEKKIQITRKNLLSEFSVKIVVNCKVLIKVMHKKKYTLIKFYLCMAKRLITLHIVNSNILSRRPGAWKSKVEMAQK